MVAWRNAVGKSAAGNSVSGNSVSGNSGRTRELAPEPSAFGLVGACLWLGIPFAPFQRRKSALADTCAGACLAGWVWQRLLTEQH